MYCFSGKATMLPTPFLFLQVSISTSANANQCDGYRLKNSNDELRLTRCFGELDVFVYVRFQMQVPIKTTCTSGWKDSRPPRFDSKTSARARWPKLFSSQEASFCAEPNARETTAQSQSCRAIVIQDQELRTRSNGQLFSTVWTKRPW